MLLNFLAIAGGLFGLYLGGEWLVKGSTRTAFSFAVSPLIIGLTIVSLGTSAPELIVSVQAAFSGSSGIALGNVIGSNIANVGLILGVTGLIKSIKIKPTLIRREIPIMLVITIFTSALVLDGIISQVDGFILLALFVVFNWFFYYLATHEEQEVSVLIDDNDGHVISTDEIKLPIEFLRIGAGIVALVVGANLLVTGASNVALAVGISELVIGLTMVAFGTSLPELAASVTAALKDEGDIVMGNVIGSNVANLLLVLGVTAFILPFDVSGQVSLVEFGVMIAFSVLLLPFARNGELSRMESAFLLVGYVAFIGYSFAM